MVRAEATGSRQARFCLMAHHFAPAHSAPRSILRTVAIEHGGRRWNAAWRLVGGSIWVDGAYGLTFAPLGGDAPEAAASRLLRRQVKTWQSHRPAMRRNSTAETSA
jgi:hypothetical protein